MSNDTQTARLLYAHDTVYETDGWIQPLLPTLRGVDAETAAWKPSPESKSIWEIVAHLTNYSEDLATDLRGVDIGKFEDWPEVAETTPAAWSGMLHRLETSVTDLRATLATLSEGDLATPPDGMKTPRWQRITDIQIHNTYHAGQVYQMLSLSQVVRPELAAPAGA